MTIKFVKEKERLVLFRQCRTTSLDPERDHMSSKYTSLRIDSITQHTRVPHMDGTRNCRLLLVTHRDTHTRTGLRACT